MSLTSDKDLRAGKPVWNAYPTPKITTHPLRQDIKCDVLIVGAGISGSLMAEELSSEGYEVVVIDKSKPLSGSTMATTALLQYEIDVPLSKLSAQMGFENAARGWQRAQLALKSLVHKTNALGISCDLREERSLYLPGRILDAEGLEKERLARRRIGIFTQLLSRAELKAYGVNAQCGLETFGNYSLNPYQFAAGCLRQAMQRGVKIYAPAEAVDIQETARRVHVQTDQGFTITARYVVFTTGYEVPKKLQKQNYKIHSTWALATAPQKKKVLPVPMLWEASDPYLYLRQTADGRIVCGGEDEEFIDEEQRNKLTEKKIKVLQRKMAKFLPDVDVRAEYSWCGSFGVTPTGLPLMGPIPRMLHCYAVMPFGGNGIISSRLGAEIISSYLVGKLDTHADLYAFKS